MEVFVGAVELGGFSGAARAFGMSPSAVSKLVTRLEARLGARLVVRTTRQIQLTPEGCAFYEKSIRILEALADAEQSASSADRPAGKVRLNTSASYATHILAPALAELLARYPDISVELVQTDAVVDVVEARSDIAVRAGPLKSSALLARKLGETRMTIVGAPAYLGLHGTPGKIVDLDCHIMIGPHYARVVGGWPIRLADGQTVLASATCRVQASDGEAIRRLAVSGVGLARLPVFTVRNDIAAGRLVPVLEEFNPGDTEAFHAVFAGQGGMLPARVRAVLDFLAEKGRVS